MGVQADVEEERRCALRRGKDRDDVVFLQHEIAARNGDRAVSLDAADQDIKVRALGKLGDRDVVQTELRTQTELEQLHAILGERVDPDGGREAEQTRNFHRRGELRIDNHGDAELLLDEVCLPDIVRGADTGDRVTAARLFRDQTAEQIELVRRGDGDQNVRVLDIRLHQRVDGGAVSVQTDGVQLIRNRAETGQRGVDQDKVMILLGKLLRQSQTDLAAADDDNFHR